MICPKGTQLEIFGYGPFSSLKILQIQHHLLRDDNFHADSLAYLASKIDLEIPRTITVEVRDDPSYTPIPEVNMIKDIKKITDADIKDTCMKPVLDYLAKEKLLDSPTRAHKVQIKSNRYIIIKDMLYPKSATCSFLRCLPPKQTNIILK